MNDVEQVVIFADFRPVKIEQRQVRDGNALHFESRSGRQNNDMSVYFGDWVRTGTILNYGEVFDPKPKSWIRRILGI